MTRLILAGLALCAFAVVDQAWATPPPKGSDADRELQRFTPEEQRWIASQHDMTGRYCCSLGDFDFVTVREVDGGLQVKAKHPDVSRGIPQDWLPVTEDKKANLQGQKDVPDVVAAWFYNGRVQCVILGGGY